MEVSQMLLVGGAVFIECKAAIMDFNMAATR